MKIKGQPTTGCGFCQFEGGCGGGQHAPWTNVCVPACAWVWWVCVVSVRNENEKTSDLLIAICVDKDVAVVDSRLRSGGD